MYYSGVSGVSESINENLFFSTLLLKKYLSSIILSNEIYGNDMFYRVVHVHAVTHTNITEDKLEL